MPLGLDPLQWPYRDAGQEASSSSLLLWLFHILRFGLAVGKFENEAYFLTVKN